MTIGFILHHATAARLCWTWDYWTGGGPHVNKLTGRLIDLRDIMINPPGPYIYF